MSRRFLSPLAGMFLLAALSAPAPCFSGTFLFAEGSGLDIITHPTGYDGTGGVLDVTICIDPASPNAAQMEIPVQNIATLLSNLAPESPNLFFGAANDIPSNAFDFQSSALHEVTHCVGLAHPNLSTESGVAGADQEYTKSRPGPDSQYDLGIGADGVRGSSDDARDDDENLHWFRVSNNNPFTIEATVDASTYSRDPADLPGGHTYAANAERSVGAELGFPDSEAVMQQGTFNDEDQRRFGHDDVATLQLAMSGFDETAGTADDYTLHMTYAGMTTSCDVVVRFDDGATGFANCVVGASSFPNGHRVITSGTVSYNTGFNWHFTTQRVDLIFTDGFESGDTTRWSAKVP